MDNINFDYKPSDLHINFLVKDVALKSLLFGMVFYILNSNLLNKLLSGLDKYQWIDKNIIQSILFGIIFYLISLNL